MARPDAVSRRGGARLAAALLALALLAGCGGNRLRVTGVGGARLDYRPPEAKSAGPASVDLPETPAEALAAAAAAMRAHGLQITIDDERALLLVGQLSGEPEPYVDCGSVEIVPGPKASEPPTSFPAAAARAQVPRTVGSQRTEVVRQMRLAARLVVSAVASGDGTQLTSRAYYVVTRSFSLPGDLASADVGPRVEAMSFTSDRPGSFPSGTTCIATGRLERLVIPISTPQPLTLLPPAS